MINIYIKVISFFLQELPQYDVCVRLKIALYKKSSKEL